MTMKLPEFRVTLTRLGAGQTAFPQGEAIAEYEYDGQRSKFGGDTDWIQLEPKEKRLIHCPKCESEMTFVAQIDSIEHDWDSNPHAVQRKDRRWMFGDVGMIYVFFCFKCGLPHAIHDCG